MDELLSRQGAQVGSEPVEVYALCLELKPDRLGLSGGKAGQGQLPAAAAAQLGSQRVAGIAQHAVEQILGPDPRIAAGLTAGRSGALAAGCGGGGVGLLVALEVRAGTGLVGGTHPAEPFELTACRLIFSDRLGCGIKWDERAVRRFRFAT